MRRIGFAISTTILVACAHQAPPTTPALVQSITVERVAPAQLVRVGVDHESIEVALNQLGRARWRDDQFSFYWIERGLNTAIISCPHNQECLRAITQPGTPAVEQCVEKQACRLIYNSAKLAEPRFVKLGTGEPLVVVIEKTGDPVPVSTSRLFVIPPDHEGKQYVHFLRSVGGEWISVLCPLTDGHKVDANHCSIPAPPSDLSDL